MLPDLKYLETLVVETAKQEILPSFNKVGFEIKQDGSLVTEADLRSSQVIEDALAKAYPEISFLSEEMTEAEQEQALKNTELLWCLDPIDGTSNFAAGVPLFASSLALFHNGEVVIGISYDPIRDEIFSAVKDKGAFLNGESLRCKPIAFNFEQTIGIVDFKRLQPELKSKLLASAPYKSQRYLGSSVLEWAWMAANRGHIYLHGGMKLWDLAAGSLILDEAGGYASTLEGEPVFNNSLESRSVVISPDEGIYKQWFEYLTT